MLEILQSQRCMEETRVASPKRANFRCRGRLDIYELILRLEEWMRVLFL